MSIATLLSQHHHVTAVDIIPEKVEMINNRKSPIQDDYIEKYLAEKDLDLTATLDAKAAYSNADFVVIVFQTLNWKMNYRYQCRGICRGQGNAKFLIFELDESRILTGRNQYEQENCSMNLKCRLYRSKWVQSITVNDVMESGQATGICGPAYWRNEEKTDEILPGYL